MRKFNHLDYATNSAKYRLFKTARLATRVFTADGEKDLLPGEYVGIEFLADVWNQLYRRTEPVYTVKNDGGIWGSVYANALCDFCL